MPKRKCGNTNELLTLSKCRRMVRPLVSKVHSLNAFNAKDPSSLELNFPYHQLYNSNKKRKVRSKMINRDLEIAQPDVSDHEKQDNLGYLSTSIDNIFSDMSFFRNTVEPCHPKAIANFITPSNSSDRLRTLKPFVSTELYRAYEEIFQIFRNIMNTLVFRKKSYGEDGALPRLSTLSSFKVGQEISLSTKSTYFKVNYTSLFDPRTLPADVKRFHEFLSEDIDTFLDMEPQVVMDRYRADILIGYVLHFIVFNLQLTLYLLVPTLIHWLKEEMTFTNNFSYGTIMRTLFHEFWLFDRRQTKKLAEISNCYQDVFSFKSNLRYFWLFFALGYWEHFLKSIGLCGRNLSFNSLMLESLVVDDKFDFDILEDLQPYFQDYDILDQMYFLVLSCPRYDQLFDFFISLLTQKITHMRIGLRHCSSLDHLLRILRAGIRTTSKYVYAWISVKLGNHSVAGSSLSTGSEEIFRALKYYINFMISKCNSIISLCKQSLDLWDSNIDSKRFLYSITMISKDLRAHIDALVILESFVYGSQPKMCHEYNMFEKACDIIVGCFTDPFSLFRPKIARIDKPEECKNFSKFLNWSASSNDPLLEHVSKKCYQKFYRYYILKR